MNDASFVALREYVTIESVVLLELLKIVGMSVEMKMYGMRLPWKTTLIMRIEVVDIASIKVQVTECVTV